MLFALCGQSAAGKTTIQQALLHQLPQCGRLTTATTRASRPGETSEDYHFLTQERFQAAMAAGQIVCPIVHRGAWYGTLRDEMMACRHHDRVGVLRPDKLPELAHLAPIISFFLHRLDLEPDRTEDERLILAYQTLCTYQVTNVPGQVEQAVQQILTLMHTHSGGSYDATH